jgi:hypothetical protein
MNRRVVSRYEMFNRVLTFGNQNGSDFAPNGVAKQEFAALEGKVGELRSLLAAGGENASVGKAVLMDALRLDAKNVWRTAYAIGQTDPAFGARFKQPDGGTEGAFLMAVDALIAELAKPGVAEQLIAHELPKDFVANLKESRAAVGEALNAAESGRQSNIQSATTMDRLVAEGLEHVTTLNAIMHNKYTGVPEKLRTWKSAIHVERPRRGRSVATGGEVVAAAAPEPAPAPG